MTTLICGFATACASAPKDLSPVGTQIPRDCEELAKQVTEPSWRKGDNPKVLLGRTTVALIQANDNLDATKSCQAKQREQFAPPIH